MYEYGNTPVTVTRDGRCTSSALPGTGTGMVSSDPVQCIGRLHEFPVNVYSVNEKL